MVKCYRNSTCLHFQINTICLATIRVVTLDSSRNCGFTLSRHQFPVKPTFAMTVHKSQGQTFDYIGVDLTQECFGHGQLYVAISRVRRFDCTKLIAEYFQFQDHKEVYLYHLEIQLKKLMNHQQMVIFSNPLFSYSV